jgi:hypothetical protein
VRHGDPLQAQAHALVSAFYQRFYGLAQVTPQPKELAHATQLLATHGEATARFLLDVSHQAARATAYEPQTFGGILSYLPRAVAAYEARATQTTTPPAEAAARDWQERYAQWRQEALARLRAAWPADELASLEAAHRTRLIAEGTPAFALGLGVRWAVDETLETRAGLPSCDAWRAAQTASHEAPSGDNGTAASDEGGSRHAS